jgi:hypothetical protein
LRAAVRAKQPRKPRARRSPRASRRAARAHRPRGSTAWERYRDKVVANALALAFLGIVLCLGIQLVGTLFAPSIPSTLVERLLLPLEEQGSPLGLAKGLPPIVAVPEDVRRAINGAARAVGVDAGYMAAVAARESAFDPTARADGTTAAGLYQFTADTWLRVVKVFGDRHGLADEAQQIAVGRDGGVSLPSAAARSKLLALRADPRLSALMAAELARDNQARLQLVLGRKVSAAEIYIAHFLGLSQAALIITASRATPGAAGAQLLPAAAARNSGVFSPAGRVASAGEIVAEIDAYFAREVSRFARM